MRKKIHVNKLVLGMFVEEFCGSWMEHPFWRSAFLLDSQADLDRIKECVTEVIIDSSKGLDVDAPPSKSKTQPQSEPSPIIKTQAPPPPKTVTLSEEAVKAKKICDKAKGEIKKMFSEARMGNAITEDQAAGLVEEISGSVMRNPSALVSLARLKTVDDYTYMHSVAVCALMISLARRLGLDEATVKAAGMAGMLHDVGKMTIPLEILNKPGKLTDEEFAIVRAHPVKGWEMLKEGSVCEASLDVCLHHHEKVDGTGYPERLSGDGISLLSKMGAICDVYDAVTSDRPYKKGWSPAESLKKMAEWNGHFDPVVFKAFVVCIGIYPVGTLVLLKSGRLAVVIDQSPKSLLTPIVKVFFSTKSKAGIPPEIVDLSKSPDSVLSVEREEKWGFKDLRRLWDPTL